MAVSPRELSCGSSNAVALVPHSLVSATGQVGETKWRKRAGNVVSTVVRRTTAFLPAFPCLALCRIDIVDTRDHVSAMAKARFAPSESSPSATVAVAERAAATDTKSSINLRIETGTRQLIDDAAAILGKTRTEFMIESARRQAVDVLLDQRLFVLDPERYDAFMQALDNPPAPGPKLKSLLRRTPAWQK